MDSDVIANRPSERTGPDKLYAGALPVDGRDVRSQEEKNSFETRVTEYQTGGNSEEPCRPPEGRCLAYA